MGRLTLEQAAAWCGGWIDPKYKDVTFFGACNDTRKLEEGQLFVVLQGVRDGHAFIPAALEKGAAAVLCTHCDEDLPAIVVPDTRIALGKIAQMERQRLGMKVVAVTGSVGKSTTKEMIATVLQTTYRVEKTPVNHNNDIGVPMAILGMKEDTQVAVLEMGMNHFREIAYLSNIGQPDFAVIINIGTSHIEYLGSAEGILQAKLEILEGLHPEGKLIINGDDNRLWGARNGVNVPVICFGESNSLCQVRGKDVQQTEEGVRMCVESNGAAFLVELPLNGAHFVSDALAAIAVALEMGVPNTRISEALASFHNMEGRQEIFKTRGYTIIKDCYNAGPESMAAALNVLGNYTGRRVAVLGDMLELGACTQAEHYKIGRIAAEKADLLLTYGQNSVRILNGARTGGMIPTKARAFTDRKKLVDVLKHMAKPGDVILFKGSRGMRMELILDQFLSEEKEAEEA